MHFFLPLPSSCINSNDYTRLTLDFQIKIPIALTIIFGFLAQAISADQSCQMGLAQIISWLASQGKKLPSANTAAYCKTRAKLPEEVLLRTCEGMW